DGSADWVRRYWKDNRYERGCLLCRKSWLGCGRKYDIKFEEDEFGCDLGHTFASSLRPAIVNNDGAAFDPAQFAQPLHKSGHPLALAWQCGRAQVPDSRQLRWLLRPHRQRPRRCRAAEQRQYLAPFPLMEMHPIPSRARTPRQDS